MSTGNLAPCPFCYHPNPGIETAPLAADDNGEQLHKKRVRCIDCGASGPVAISGDESKANNKAIWDWNAWHSRWPTCVVLQQVQTAVSRFGLHVDHVHGKTVHRWSEDPKEWTRLGMDDAVTSVVSLGKRGFACTIEVAP